MKGYMCAAITAAAILTNGCASIITNGKYPTTFNSNPSGATVTVTNSEGIDVYRGQTPYTVTLKASDGYFKKMKYTARFEDPCYKPTSVNLQTGITGWYWGNLLFGGLIGFLVVDPATGDMYKIDPDHYSVAMTPLKIPGCIRKNVNATAVVQPPLADPTASPARSN